MICKSNSYGNRQPCKNSQDKEAPLLNKGLKTGPEKYITMLQ